MKTLLPLSILALLAAGPLHAQLALIRQGPETAGQQENGDQFGAAVCAGDFNGDGYDDLATGVPGERLGASLVAGGYVTVNYGTAYGLTWQDAEGRGPAQAGLDENEAHEMGTALASADFNADTYDDLAVGLPGSPVGGIADSGRVLIFMGSQDGLISTAALVLTQTQFGGANEAGDRFGAALAAGRLGIDAYADLVIGGPGENGTGSGPIGEGAVFIIRGGVDGLDPGVTKFITGETAQAGNGAHNGGYGTSLAIGQLISDGAAELAVGAPYLPDAATHGKVFIHASSPTSVVNAAAHVLAASADPFDPHPANAGFGYSMAIGRFHPLSDPAVDTAPRALAIGGLGDGSLTLARSSGAAMIFYHQLKAPTSISTNNIIGYARALASADFDGDGDDDLGIGVPLIPLNATPDGPVWSTGLGTGVIVYRRYDRSTDTWVTEYEGQVNFDEGSTGAGYRNGAMGTSLAPGQFSGGPRWSLAVGCPGSPTYSSQDGYVVDHAPWRQVWRPGCESALSADCQGNIVYALRPFDRKYIASTTKIMTVLLGCEATARPASDPLHEGLGEYYPIPVWLAIQFQPSTSCTKWVFAAGHSYTFHDLMRTCIMKSGNDSAYAIADAMTGEVSSWNGYAATVPQFTALMNARAAQIGMDDTLFTNPAGVDTGDPYSTAWDMWLLGRTAMQNALFRSIVGDTEELITYKLGDGTLAQEQCNYGWLSGLKSQDARITGVKPGGTQKAGRTCVLAGEPVEYPGERAFGIGLGWHGMYQDESQRARVEILQVALNVCGPPPPVLSTGPLTDVQWPLLDPSDPWKMQGLLEPKGPGQRSVPVEFHFARPTHLAATPPLEVKLIHDILFDIPASGETELAMTGVEGRRTFLLRNTGEQTVPVIVEAPGRTRITLAPNQTHTIPAAAGAFSIKILTDGAPLEVTLSGDCLLTPRWVNTTFAPAVTARMELPDHVVQHAWKLIACPLTNLPQPFPLRVIVDEPFNGLTFPRVPEVDALLREPAGANERLTFDFHGIPGLEPANGYDILGSTGLDGAWQTHGRIPPVANGEARYRSTLSLPAASRRFLKITPAP